MPASHDLNGLIKFLSRDKWRDCFEEVLDDHFGSVLETEGIEFSDLPDILGDGWVTTLWGCAFEDLLTRDFEVEGVNIVDDYLKRRSWKEGAQSKAYMKALRSSFMSLYEVSDVIPGKSFMARDLVRAGDTILVSEGTATKTLKQWDCIAARIVPIAGKMIVAGGLLPFTPEASEIVFDLLRTRYGKKRSRKLPALTDQQLQVAAPIFTLAWLFDTLDRIKEPEIPVLENSDGDEIVSNHARFPLASGATQKDIAALLKESAVLRPASAKFWNWIDEAPKIPSRSGKADNNHILDTMMDDGARVLGNVELAGRNLHLSTNSAARAAKGTALLQELLGNLIRAPLTEILTVEQMLAEKPADSGSTLDADLSPEFVTQISHKFLDKHYRELLDQPVKILGRASPREAVKTARGREETAKWLKYLENQSAKQPDPTDPMATYDFQWIWTELGIENLRK